MADLELLKRPYLSALEVLGWSVLHESGTTLTVELGNVAGHLTLDPDDPSTLRVWVSLDLEGADPVTAAKAAPVTSEKVPCVKVIADGRSDHVVLTVEALVSGPGLLPPASDILWRLQGTRDLLIRAVQHFAHDAMVLAGIEIASEAA